MRRGEEKNFLSGISHYVRHEGMRKHGLLRNNARLCVIGACFGGMVTVNASKISGIGERKNTGVTLTSDVE